MALGKLSTDPHAFFLRWLRKGIHEGQCWKFRPEEPGIIQVRVLELNSLPSAIATESSDNNNQKWKLKGREIFCLGFFRSLYKNSDSVSLLELPVLRVTQPGDFEGVTIVGSLQLLAIDGGKHCLLLLQLLSVRWKILPMCSARVRCDTLYSYSGMIPGLFLPWASQIHWYIVCGQN